MRYCKICEDVEATYWAVLDDDDKLTRICATCAYVGWHDAGHAVMIIRLFG